MVLYNALPKKEYEIIFMYKTEKDIWKSLLITHQGNSQLKNNRIDLLVQQYEQFTILEEESIDSGFGRINTIITSLKVLDEGFSSKNYIRKFLRALHPKWRAKVTTIEESKDLSSLALDELISNLEVHKLVMEKDSKIYKGEKERVKSIVLKAKKESSDDETSISKSDDKEYAITLRNFKKFFRRKASRNKDQKMFIGGCWSDSENEVEDKINDETCLMAQSSNEVTLDSSNYSDNAYSFDDVKPKNVNEALGDESWVVAMQEELNQFIANDVWDLVPLPNNHNVIGIKWVYRNKLDENGIVYRNKARLVAQGYNQQEGIDYDEPYAPVARL
ncbi:zf-CCHC domain-containing protein [Tanacetum coccineum]